MHVVAISFKKCWQLEDGNWYSSGGFPLQMTSIASLFDQTTLLITKGDGTNGKIGGIPLPPQARVVGLRSPKGADFRRKIDVIVHLPYYLWEIVKGIHAADVVHTPLPGDLALLGLITAWLMKKKIIARYGGSWALNNQNTTMNNFTRWFLRKIAGGKNVVLISGIGNIPPEPGMHWLFSTAVSRSEINVSGLNLNRGLSNPPQFSYIGRLSPEKGVRYLLEAIYLLRLECFEPMPQITILGDGPLRNELEGFVQKWQIAAWVTFAGQLNRSQLSETLKKMDLCVQASLTEALSKAWLDAFAFGLPVIAGTVGAARETVGAKGERGWQVEPGNARDLADCIKKIILEKHDWPQLRMRCRQFVDDKTLEDWAEKIGGICGAQWKITFNEGKLNP